MKPVLLLTFLQFAFLLVVVHTATAQTGQPELAFNNTGYVITLAPGSRDVLYRHAAIQADGKIIAAGFASFDKPSGADDDFLLVRYNPDGSIDASFGINGYVTTDFGSGNNPISQIAIQADGKIVAAGRTDWPGATTASALARYLPDGSLDNTFGDGGKVVLNLSEFADDQISSVGIQQDGRILIAGTYSHFNSTNESDIFLARLTSNGQLDNSFGVAGKTLTDFDDGFDLGIDLFIYQDGKVLVTGVADGSDVALVKYNTDGSLDNTFGTGGKVRTDVNNSPGDIGRSIDVQEDNKIVVGGATFVSGPGENGTHFLLVRYLPNGTLDNSFGQNGIVVTDFGPSHDDISSLLLHNNKIIVGGTTKTSISTDRPENFDLALARYNLDGTLDASFGNAGKVTSDFSEQTGLVSSESAAALAVFGNTLYAVGGRTLFQTADDFSFRGLVAAYQLEQVTTTCVVDGLSASPAVLWPPNNKMKPVTISYQLVGNCLSDVNITITKDEEDKASEIDWEVVDDHHILLRAERNGSGDGRVYTIRIDTRDEAGATVSATTSVIVPKSMAGGNSNSQLNERTKMSLVSLGANPTSSYFELRVNNYNTSIKAKVYDVYGRLVETSSFQNSWNFGYSYIPGVYLVVVDDGEKTQTIRATKVSK